MLHEILLSLSGHPSPLLSKRRTDEDFASGDIDLPLLSPPERALLTALSDLRDLHVKLRELLSSISASHPSIICRAISTNIASAFLREFQSKILEVEKSVLAKDAGYVGGYGIVPLSTVVSEFAPWTRRLQWLWTVANFMVAGNQGIPQGQNSASGVVVIDFLRKESCTGYDDIESMALNLIEVAEMAWLRLLSSWLLYGRMPTIGADDLFIKKQPGSDEGQLYTVDDGLLPSFVSREMSDTMLLIGQSLNQIRSRNTSSITTSSSLAGDPVASLLPVHLQYLESLKSPLSSSELATAISAIRLSLSRNALAHLLPKHVVLETFDILHRFMLLQDGEFAISIIGNADKRIRGRLKDTQQKVRKAGLVDGLRIKDGEVAAVLTQTWAELAALQEKDDFHDEIFELGRDMVQLSLTKPSHDKSEGPFPQSDTRFDDLLFPTHAALALRLVSPLDLFLSTGDIQWYSAMSSLLLAIRRAEVHLSGLWQTSLLRRCQPSPAGPPFSASTYGSGKLRERRVREATRQRRMRAFWATANAALYLVTELDSYLQGFVVHNHSTTFLEWLKRDNRIQPATSSGPIKAGADKHEVQADSGRAAFPSDGDTTATPLDPATLSSAHRKYLRSLSESLFLTSESVMRPLHDFLVSVEHLVALFNRLSGIYANLDLEAEGVDVTDPTRSFAAEEQEVLDELGRTRSRITELMQEFATAVKTWETENDHAQSTDLGDAERELSGGFVPWSQTHGGSARGVEVFIMRLDFLDPDLVKDDGEDEIGLGL